MFIEVIIEENLKHYINVNNIIRFRAVDFNIDDIAEDDGYLVKMYFIGDDYLFIRESVNEVNKKIRQALKGNKSTWEELWEKYLL